MFLEICVLAFVQSVSPISPGKQIKGHTLGETAEEFIQKEPQITAEIAKCKRQKDYLDSAYCKGLIAGLELPLRGTFLVEYPGPTGDRDASTSLGDELHFTFEKGKLVRIEAWLRSSYSIVLESVSSRFGPPTSAREIPFQNAFGARWSNPLTEWASQDFYLSLYKDMAPASGATWPFLVLETSGERKAELEKSRDPLDK